MREGTLAGKVFAGLGLAGVGIGLVLAFLGSFAYPAALAVALVFIAAALMVRRRELP